VVNLTVDLTALSVEDRERLVGRRMGGWLCRLFDQLFGRSKIFPWPSGVAVLYYSWPARTYRTRLGELLILSRLRCPIATS